MEPLFHLSIPVDDLDRAKAFYLDTLGCQVPASILQAGSADWTGELLDALIKVGLAEQLKRRIHIMYVNSGVLLPLSEAINAESLL